MLLFNGGGRVICLFVTTYPFFSSENSILVREANNSTLVLKVNLHKVIEICFFVLYSVFLQNTEHKTKISYCICLLLNLKVNKYDYFFKITFLKSIKSLKFIGKFSTDKTFYNYFFYKSLT